MLHLIATSASEILAVFLYFVVITHFQRNSFGFLLLQIGVKFNLIMKLVCSNKLCDQTKSERMQFSSSFQLCVAIAWLQQQHPAVIAESLKVIVLLIPHHFYFALKCFKQKQPIFQWFDLEVAIRLKVDKWFSFRPNDGVERVSKCQRVLNAMCHFESFRWIYFYDAVRHLIPNAVWIENRLNHLINKYSKCFPFSFIAFLAYFAATGARRS